MRMRRVGGWVKGFFGCRIRGQVARRVLVRHGDTGPFLDCGHDAFTGRVPIVREGEAAVGQVADAHIDADDVLALQFINCAIFRESQSAVLELMVQPCCQDWFRAARTDPRCVRNELQLRNFASTEPGNGCSHTSRRIKKIREVLEANSC